MRRLAFVPTILLALAACTESSPLGPGPSDVGSDGGAPDAAAKSDGGADDAGGADVGEADAGELPEPAVRLFFGDDVPPAVAERVEAHLRAVASRPVTREAEFSPPYAPATLLLAIGEHPLTRRVIASSELTSLGSEAFVVRTAEVDGHPVLAADGRRLEPDPFGHANLGIAYAAYVAMERLGFAFLHPLAPTRPARLPEVAPATERVETPRWRIRGLQLHTMHPLELSDLLNGWGPLGPEDETGWRAMLPEWDAAVEWLVANRQNRVHWVLLWAESWASFADGAERRARLAELVDRAHRFGVAVGVDVPIALHQQHAFRLIREEGTLEEELDQLRRRVDHLMGAGFDYLATENGNSEFTHGEDTRLLAWMDGLAEHLDEAHGKPAYIKIHVSQGQFAETLTDPDTGGPLNVNFIPHYASPKLGVLPHTVQHYALDDPAPTYGNTDFNYMREFLQEEVGRREVVWHPESAYWVSFDVDVPLYLPVYAERRFHDLRLLSADERAGRMGRGPLAGGAMDGQLTFSSGWEWGYWLNDVVTARAAWNPRDGIEDETEALRDLLAEVFAPFGDAAPGLVEHVLQTAAMQKSLLIDGEVSGRVPSDVVRRNGQAYLQGSETWDDVSDLAASLPLPIGPVSTQPDKLGLVEMRNPLHDPPGYSREVEPLLDATERAHREVASALEQLGTRVPDPVRPLFDDLLAAARITALRAEQVHGLYDYVDGQFDLDDTRRNQRLQVARAALDAAADIVAERETHYRVPADRVAAWRPGPTAYGFGYLWTVRSLFFWWRDEGKAVDAPVSPCYLNIIHPLDVGFGEGLLVDAARLVRALSEDWAVIGSVTECLAEPDGAPTLPPPGLR